MIEKERYMRTEYYLSCDEVVSELVDTLYDHFGKAPLSWTKVDRLTEYLLDEQYIENVFQLKKHFSSTQYIIDKINPSQLIKIIYKYQIASKYRQYDIDTIQNYYLFLANYSIKVRNKRLQDINIFLKNNSFIRLNNEEQAAINYLNATIRGLSEVLFYDEHTIAGEIYAPVYTDNGHCIIVRDFNYLNPFQLYSIAREQRICRVIVYCEYPGECNFETNLVGNIICNMQYAKKLIGAIVHVFYNDGSDEIITNINDCDEITHELILFLKEILTIILEKSIKERLWNKILCEHYAFSPVNEHWRPKYYHLNMDIEKENNIVVDINRRIGHLEQKEDIKALLYTLNDPKVHSI